jgi:hypothetical protein
METRWHNPQGRANVRPVRDARVTALVAYAAFSVVCAFIPLFNLLAFEFAFVAGIPLSLHAGVLGARGSAGPRALGHLAAACVGLLVPITVNALRVQNCNWLDGAHFFIVLPLTGAVVAYAVGRACAARALTHPVRMFVALWLGSVAWSVGAFVFGPAVDAFHPFLGYYPGSLYDEVITIDLRLWTSRGEDVAFALAAWAWAARSSWQVRAGSTAAACAALAAALTLDVHRPTMRVEAALGGLDLSPGFRLVYPREWSEAQVGALRTELGFVANELDVFFEVRPTEVTSVYLYRTEAEKKRLMGARNVRIAKPWQHAVHLHGVTVGDTVLAHELAHVWSASIAASPHRLSLTPWGLPNMGLIEGVAVAAAWDEGVLDAHAWTAAMRRLSVDTPIERLLSPTGFLGTASRAAYTQCGSFVRWLRDTEGTAALATLYRAGGLADTDTARVKAWQDYVDAVEVDAGALALARVRFDRPAIFRKVCAHEIAALRSRAERDLARGRDERALARLEAWLGHVPGDPEAELMRVEALFRMGRVDDAKRLVETLRGVQGLGLARAARIDEWALDLDTGAASASARPAVANRYAALRDTVFERGALRRLSVKAIATAAGADDPGIFDLLTGGEARRADGIARLASALPGAPEDAPLTWTMRYLVARDAAARDDCASAAPLLERGRVGVAPHWSLAAETARLEAACAFTEGHFAQAATLFATLASRADLPLEGGERDGLRQWARRSRAFEAAAQR